MSRLDEVELTSRTEMRDEWDSPLPRPPPPARRTPPPAPLPVVSSKHSDSSAHAAASAASQHSVIRLVATLIIGAVLALFLFETIDPPGATKAPTVTVTEVAPSLVPSTTTTAASPTDGPPAPAPTAAPQTATTKPSGGPSLSSLSPPHIDNSYWYFPPQYGATIPAGDWGVAAPPTALLSGPGISTDADIDTDKRRPRVGSVLQCAAQAADDTTRAYRFPVVFTPIGCFGDDLGGRKCDEVQSTSCELGAAVAKLVGGCSGGTRVGAFLGDNFYPYGLKKSRDQPRFDHELTQKFWRHSALQMPWLMMVGNHDGRPDTQRRVRIGSPLHAEIVKAEAEEATSSASPVDAALRSGGTGKAPRHAPFHPYAHMPEFHFASEVFGSGDTTVQFFIISTQWGFTANDAHMADEAEWLDGALRDSTAKWKLVLSHEPIWGFMNFPHGRGLAQNIHPVLLRYGVQFYVCAHQHSVSMLRAPGGYYQIISAGFADNLHDAVKPRRPAGHYHVGRGAVNVLFNASHAVVVAYTSAGRLIFAHAVRRDEVDAALAAGGRKGKQQPTTQVTVPSVADLQAAGRVAQTSRLAKLAQGKSGGGTIAVPLDAELEGETGWGAIADAPKSIWDSSATPCAAFLPGKGNGC